MYIPHHFQFKNPLEKIAFMKQNSFATIITSINNIPFATQLPFDIDDSRDKPILCSHFAVSNKQAEYIEENTSLVIFSGPHGYISPVHYDKNENVPTWDYISVHAYGKAKIISEEWEKEKVLEKMIRFYEQNYLTQWKNLSDKYKKGMMKGIIAFEMEITDLQGIKKLSQNRTDNERMKIVRHLNNSNDTTEQELAKHIEGISKDKNRN